LRSSNYDSTFFIKILPYLKKGTNNITTNQRNRVIQSLHQAWSFYFNINEPYDFAYEIGGFLYDLGAYADALTYFQYSENIYGKKDDIYYNRVLCYYQLRQDELFSVTLKEAKEKFPNNKLFEKLDALDLNAK
jgi:tetratricopeptide (TPR) repeat protein